MKQKSTWKVAKYEALESVILTVQRRGTLVISPNHCPCPLVQKCSGRQRDKKPTRLIHVGRHLPAWERRS